MSTPIASKKGGKVNTPLASGLKRKLEITRRLLEYPVRLVVK